MTKAALIFATDERALVPVFTVPAVRRLVRLTLQSGFDPVLVIGKVEGLSQAFSDLLYPTSLIPIEAGQDLEPLLAAHGIREETRVLATSAHTVVDRHSLVHFLEDSESPGIHFLEGRGKNGGSVCLGRFDSLLPLLEDFRHGSAQSHPHTPAHKVMGVAGLPVCLENTPDSAEAEQALISALSFQTADDDGFFARHFDRPISRFFSRRLAHTGITPNQITLIGVTIGLTGAFLLSLNGYWSKLLGALLFLFCVVVDGVDGEVARLKLQESVFGHYLDIITDNVVHVAVFIGIAYGLYHDARDPAYLQALWWMLGGFALCIVAVYQCILRKSQEELDRSPRLVRLLALLSNRDFAYLVVLLALLHRLDWFLFGAAVGTYLFAATLWLLSFYENRRAVADVP